MAVIDRRALLARLELFDGVSERALDQLVEMTTTKQLAARAELYHKGDQGAQLYGVLSGRLKVTSAVEAGREALFVHLGPGEVVGEIALLDGGERSATIVAVEPTELLVLHRRDFLAFLREHSEVAIHLAQLLAGRVRRLSETVEDAFFKNLPARLAKKLLALADQYGSETAGSTRIDVQLSQSELGDLIGKTREAVNKQLRAWKEDGLVTTTGRYLTIHDMEELERVARHTDF